MHNVLLQKNKKKTDRYLGYTAADLAARLFLENNLNVIEGITTSSTALEFWNSEHRDLLEKYQDEEDRGISYRVADFMSLPYVFFNYITQKGHSKTSTHTGTMPNRSTQHWMCLNRCWMIYSDQNQMMITL